jgi:hypothetical protein
MQEEEHAVREVDVERMRGGDGDARAGDDPETTAARRGCTCELRGFGRSMSLSGPAYRSTSRTAASDVTNAIAARAARGGAIILRVYT